MKLRHDTTWTDLIGVRVWAKFATNPCMLEFTVHEVMLDALGELLVVDTRPDWGWSLAFPGGLWLVRADDFKLLAA